MKVLFIRFSSIGDIVLTFPVVAAFKEKYPESQISFLSKEVSIELLAAQPHIDNSISFNGSILKTRKWVKNQNFDVIVDLHKNIRSITVSALNARKVFRFNKLNFHKKIYTTFKIDILPEKHIVDRYFEALSSLHLNTKSISTSFEIPKKSEVDLNEVFGAVPVEFLCIALGAKFNTKKIPLPLLVEIVEQINVPIALLGGQNDIENGEHLIKKFTQKTLVNCAGKYTILQSASILKKAGKLITGDTGLMHIASFFDTQIITIWGNTSPKFGMYPYRQIANNKDVMFEKKELKCRPCSKIGFDSCPKGHFNCMKHEANDILKALQ
mgnify:CR=1 FL=1